MPLRTLLACYCVAVWSVTPARADEAPVRTHYAGFVRGLHVFDMDLALSLHPTAYRMQLSFRLAGVLAALFHAQGTTVVDGRFDGARALPREALSTGQFGGVARVTQIEWPDGSPKVTQMVPPAEPEREAVPLGEQAHSIDVLSAIATLLRQVTATGRCEAAARTFDGARLSEFASSTAGEEALAPSARSSFQGQALRCDVTGRMIGGFMRDGDQTALRKPKKGSAWFARLRIGQPLVPVRINLYADDAIVATLYLAEPPPA